MSVSSRSLVIAGIVTSTFLSACNGGESVSPLGPGMHPFGGSDSALVDTRVDHTPTVAIYDASSKPLSGVAVTFRIVAGGGTLTDSVVTTKGDGTASPGGLTTGLPPTANVIEASAPGYPAVRFTIATRWRRTLASQALGACAIVSDKVYCWGDNTHGELGTRTPASALTPQISPITISQAGSAGLSADELVGGFGNHLCALSRSQKTAACWGRGSYGQRGIGRAAGELNDPVNLSGGSWERLSVGRLTSCGIQTSGRAMCWGANQYGEVGNLSWPASGSTRILGPVFVDGGILFSVVSTGWLHACGVTTTGEAFCWGNNLAGQLGIGAVDSSHAVPTHVASSEKFATIFAGNRHTCAITTDQRAFCWGENTFGQLGDGTTTSRPSPTPVAGGLKFSAISIGSFFISALPPGATPLPPNVFPAHTCALTEAGRAYCWGWNAWAELGDGTLTDRLQPTPVATDARFSGLALGEASSCGMRGSSVWCWGGNQYGQLGDGTQQRRMTPVRPILP